MGTIFGGSPRRRLPGALRPGREPGAHGSGCCRGAGRGVRVLTVSGFRGIVPRNPSIYPIRSVYQRNPGSCRSTVARGTDPWPPDPPLKGPRARSPRPGRLGLRRLRPAMKPTGIRRGMWTKGSRRVHPNGVNEKVRRAVVLTPNEVLQRDGPIVIAAISGTLPDVLTSDYVLLPWHNSGHPPGSTAQGDRRQGKRTGRSALERLMDPCIRREPQGRSGSGAVGVRPVETRAQRNRGECRLGRGFALPGSRFS